MSDRYECLKLKNQLCFPLYAASKEIVRLYKPWLDEIDLTYTQYITMMVLWEKRESNVKELGKCLYLDSGTLTPLLKKLEGKGLIERHRSEEDECNLIIRVTEQGMRLRERAADVPARVGSCVQLSPEEARTLYELTYKVLESID